MASSKGRKLPRLIITILICLVLIIGASSCGTDIAPQDSSGSSSGSPPVSDTDPIETGSSSPEVPSDTDTGNEVSPETPMESETETAQSPDPTPEIKLVPYDGVVEHLFFHEVIAFPEITFGGVEGQRGYDNYMVTVSEYTKILHSMHAKGFILVNLNDVWSEYTNENGVRRMKKNTLMLPEGKKPLVLSFDDINFYDYMINDGFMEKLIIGDDGEIWATGFDVSGKHITTQDYTVVTVLDKFVKEHPDFSLNGVKGCIALTGYQGILGYRTQADKNNTSEEFRLNRMQEAARVRPVIQKLKDTGWYFASHSYGHIDLNNASFNGMKNDADRWMDEVGSLIGPTTLFIYPFGSRLDGGDVNKTGPAFEYYHELGFRVFASVGYEPYSKIKSDICAVICDRMHSDGMTLRNERERYMKFYDAAEVFDPYRPAQYGKSW
ncbi:MAG: polysaccharide deacetylase family protein [Oscillospiraceae bacterium]|nr:polysaccharide deacetylase family protein [Oscillospiraceae bacterium]